jgi:hypothetical protein
MPQGKVLSPSLRSHMCQLQDLGYSYSQIQNIHTYIPLSTIKSTCYRKAKRSANNLSLPHSGAP